MTTASLESSPTKFKWHDCYLRARDLIVVHVYYIIHVRVYIRTLLHTRPHLHAQRHYDKKYMYLTCDSSWAAAAREEVQNFAVPISSACSCWIIFFFFFKADQWQAKITRIYKLTITATLRIISTIPCQNVTIAMVGFGIHIFAVSLFAHSNLSQVNSNSVHKNTVGHVLWIYAPSR